MSNIDIGSERWDDVGFLVASKHRIAVCHALGEGPDMPSGIAETADLSITHVSRALGDLRERGLVKLLVRDSRSKGRIYALEARGDDALTDAIEHGLLDGRRNEGRQ